MSYLAAVLATAPDEHYALDETSGTVAVDSSGNGRHGTYVGSHTKGQPSIVNGGGTSVEMSGGRIDVPVLDISNKSFTSAMWLKPSDVTGSSNGYTFYHNFHSVTTGNYHYTWLLKTGQPLTTFQNEDVYGSIGEFPTPAPRRFLVVRYDADADLASIWIDAVKIAEGAAGPMRTAGIMSRFFQTDAGVLPYHGGAQHLSVWASRALTDEEIAELYGAGVGNESAAIAVTLPMFTVTAAVSYTPPDRAAAITATLPALTIAATATYTPPVWNRCADVPATSWEPCAPELIAAWLWLELEESETGTAADSSGNDREGTYGSGVSAFGVAGPSDAGNGVAVDGSGNGVTVAALTRNNINWLNADPEPPEGYNAPAIHTQFTLRFWARPTALQAVPAIMGDPVGTGITPVGSLNTCRFITVPEHGCAGALTTSDRHAGIAPALGTNCILVAEHAHNHIPCRAVYEADLSGWHLYHIVVESTAADGVKIYVDRLHAADLAGTYRQGESARSRPFLSGSLLTTAQQATWLSGFEGDVADFRVYDRALTADEIANDIPTSTWSNCAAAPSTAWAEC